MCAPHAAARTARRALLAVIVLVAIFFRSWGLSYGLPGLNHPDEPDKVAIAQRMVRTGDLNPHYFKKGTLLIYATAVSELAYFATGRVLGWFDSLDDLAEPKFLVYGTGWTALPGTFLAPRWLTVLVGAASVILVYVIAAGAASDLRAGLAAAAFAAVAPVAVENSRYIAVDAYAVFFCLAVVVFSLRIYRFGRLRDFIASGLAAGFAIGSKYPAGLILVAPLLAHLLGRGRAPVGLKGIAALAGVAVAAAIGFFATTPYALLAPQEFVRDFVFEKRHYTTGHVGMEGGAVAFYADVLWNTEGAILCVLAVAGVSWLAFADRRLAAVLLVFPIVYFASIAGLPVRNARTLLPALPFLYVFAGIAVAVLWRRLAALERGRAVAMAVAAALFVWALSFAADRTAYAARRADSRTAVENARRWVEDNVPPGSRVLLESYAPYVDPDRYRVQAQPFLIQTDLPNLRFDYVIAARGSYGRFYRDPIRHQGEVAAYDRMFASMQEVAKFTDFSSEIRIFAVPNH
jgi:4-amino-4-deoxy-L-arabinose transferase-like glycosyltransferase